MNPNKKRAAIWAVGALLICLIPLGARVWLERHGAIERPELGAVGEFIIRDQNQVPLNRDQLRRSVTVILNWPKACLSSGNCEAASKTVGNLMEWVSQSLKPKWTEENNPLNLVIVGEGASSLPRSDGWRVFTEKAEPGTIIPLSADPMKPLLVVVDNNLLFGALEDLNGQVHFDSLERILSKTAFDQYLGNYLSSRTFMGPKRRQN